MKKSSLFFFAILCFLLGGATAFASGRIVCVLSECILVTEGDDLLSARGFSIDSGTAGLIQGASTPLFVVGGALLVGGFVMQNKAQEG